MLMGNMGLCTGTCVLYHIYVALVGILNAVLSCVLFPRKFKPDWRYGISLCMVLIAIGMCLYIVNDL